MPLSQNPIRFFLDYMRVHKGCLLNLQVQKLFLDFNKFNIVLTEQLWYLDLDNKSALFEESLWKMHTGTVYILGQKAHTQLLFSFGKFHSFLTSLNRKLVFGSCCMLHVSLPKWPINQLGKEENML